MKALKELKQSTKLPFIVKGIMTVQDALMAVECGARCYSSIKSWR